MDSLVGLVKVAKTVVVVCDGDSLDGGSVGSKRGVPVVPVDILLVDCVVG